MKQLLVSSFLFIIGLSASAQQPSDWPLRSIEVGSKFTILPEILPSHQFEEGSTYQHGERVFPGTVLWDDEAPFCRVDYSSINNPFISVYEDDVFQVTGISGRYYNDSLELHYDHPYFETELTLSSSDKPNHFFIVKCFSYKQDHFGEMSIDQIFKTFGHRLTAKNLNLKSPGKYSSAPINNHFVLEQHHLTTNTRFDFLTDMVLTRPADDRDFYRVSFQEGKIIETFEQLDITKDWCQLSALYDDEIHSEKPENITLPKGLETHLQEVEIRYGKGKTDMLTPPWFEVSGTLRDYEGEIPVKISCHIKESTSYVRERDIRPIVKGLLWMTYVIVFE